MTIYTESLLPQLEEIARRAAEPVGVDVAWVELKRERSSWFFRVFIDRESGVGLRDCELVSERLGVLLDVEDPIDSSYTLEVSTPGLDRPLFKREDYERFVGRRVRIRIRETLDGRKVFRGKLTAVEGELVVLEDRGTKKSIPLPAIERGRLEVDAFGTGRGHARSRKQS
ncbi:MAG: ribosome maturation factor RimP [Acidobacteriota bacterium]